MILSNAKQEMKELSNSANPNIYPVLQQIDSRIANSKNVDSAFGLAVKDLLNKFKFPDISIMDEFYALHPDFQGQSWVQTLSKYRGAVIHTGYFSFDKYDIQDIVILEDHLHDILVRIALTILDYQEEYQPRVIQKLVDKKTMTLLQ